jgi:ubiquinone biosynthesis monooxygenase Coq7
MGFGFIMAFRFSLPSVDALLSEVDSALKTLIATPLAQRPNPGRSAPESDLNDQEKNKVIALMRVDHVGEICAQALYQGQALASKDPGKKALFMQAAQEEVDHLAWTQERLKELGARPSLLNPFWYGSSFVLGYWAGQVSDKISLGFMAETEKQVERHLERHLSELPAADHNSRAILEQMKQDEIEHAQAAIREGGIDLPLPVRLAMKGMSKVMTTLAQKI